MDGGPGGADAMNGRNGGFVAKRASKSTRVTAAERGGRTIGRTAKRSNSLRAASKKATPKKATSKKATSTKAIPKKAIPKKAIPKKPIPMKPIPTGVTPLTALPEKAVPAEVTPETEPNRDPGAEATQTALRKTWKGQQQDAAAFAKTQHGIIVDQRAHVRATTGHRWTARKTH